MLPTDIEKEPADSFEINDTNSKTRHFEHYTFALLFVWTVLITFLIILQLNFNRKATKSVVVNEARELFMRDQAFRFWGASHGGVYVPITSASPPNPYLTFIDDRDVETLSGKKLTLINPAYMVRQMNEMFAELYGIVGHITSLKTLNPNNDPDDWEEAALHSFDKGEKEVYEFMDYKGKEFLRFMQPLITQQSCLKCHGHQGYKVGDVRGGISISLPMIPYLAREHKQSVMQAIYFGLLWMLGLLGIALASRDLKRRIIERDIAYEEIKRYQVQLEMLVKKRTAQLEEKVEEVERANKELQNFTHIVSHDLKSPLTSILGMADLLQRDYGEQLDDTGIHFIDRIIANTKLMNNMIEDLLDLGQIGRIKEQLEKIDLNGVIRQIIEENRQAINENNVIVNIDYDLPTISFARIRVYQLFSNLIRNALKFMREDVTPQITIKYDQTDDEHIISVSDNGIGIDKEYWQKIFGMFLRLKDKEVEGTGIGLTIVSKIVTENNGRVWVESKKGEGSTFYIALKKDA